MLAFDVQNLLKKSMVTRELVFFFFVSSSGFVRSKELQVEEFLPLFL